MIDKVELKRCWSCGEKARIPADNAFGNLYTDCTNENCRYFLDTMRVEIWQSRPLEDALQKRLDIAMGAMREAIATNELPRHIEDGMTDILTELEATND